MNIWLLANIGTRDVHLDPDSLATLPDTIKHARSGMLIPRLAGDYLRQPEVFDVLKERITLPMIEKALHYIESQYKLLQNDKSSLWIVLFGTNQPEYTPANFRDFDTISYAHLMRQWLFERYQRHKLVKKQILVQEMADNPADYDVMYDYYRNQLPRIAQEKKIVSDDRVYLLIAGGTPQMNTMLLFVGSEVFGIQASPIYVSPDKDRAAMLDIVRQIYTQALRRNLEVLLQAYAYASARKLVEQQPDLLEPWQESLLLATLRYAEARRNLDLERAAAAFDTVFQGTRSLREEVRMLQQDVSDTSDRIKLQETIYLAQIAAETGNWPDFLARLHRFSEGCLQLMAEQLGVTWNNPTRTNFEQSWWHAHRERLSVIGLADAVPPADPKSEDYKRRVDRDKLRKIIGHWLQALPAHPYLDALAALEVVDRPIPLRNRQVHDFTPISQEDVSAEAHMSIDDILAHMRRAYCSVFDITVPDEHAYRAINRLCQRILEGTR